MKFDVGEAWFYIDSRTLKEHISDHFSEATPWKGEWSPGDGGGGVGRVDGSVLLFN
jgi:hypothetical protein